MSVISDQTIREYLDSGRLIIKPSPIKINPGSVELTLGSEFIHFQETRQTEIDIKERIPEVKDGIPVRTTANPKKGFAIYPNTLYLATTLEYIKMPDDLQMRVEGKSTIGRYGLVPVTAGMVDPGFEGHITLEVFSLNPLPVIVYPGMCFAQAVFYKLDKPAEASYASRKHQSSYQGQRGVTMPNPKNLFLPGWEKRLRSQH